MMLPKSGLPLCVRRRAYFEFFRDDYIDTESLTEMYPLIPWGLYAPPLATYSLAGHSSTRLKRDFVRYFLILSFLTTWLFHIKVYIMA
ncbi:MAG: hypothetical protein DRP47_11040 [Candidatus Zixiibacteriota bacterium]|nr:MAG: hypothetical protein DRP47_11040 [candidate division Zixibacteria bacterium]